MKTIAELLFHYNFGHSHGLKKQTINVFFLWSIYKRTTMKTS